MYRERWMMENKNYSVFSGLHSEMKDVFISKFVKMPYSLKCPYDDSHGSKSLPIKMLKI